MTQSGFEVRPAALQAGAEHVRADSDDIAGAGQAGSQQAGAAAAASGGDPLAAALVDLADGLTSGSQALASGLAATAGDLDASAATYLSDDQHAAHTLGALTFGSIP